MNEYNGLIKELMPNISDDSLESLYIYYELLREESKKINLTTITELEDVYIKHFYDSLLVNKIVSLNNKSLIDIGTGAGFPGLVLAIAYPSLKVTLVEPTTKRCKFLELVVEKLKLKNVIIINNRAEKLDMKLREKYDYATARAVSSLPILLELMTPYLKVEGQVIALKGSEIDNELINSQNAINILSLSNTMIHDFNLPNDKGKRKIITLKKDKITKEKYPREYSKIKNKPL